MAAFEGEIIKPKVDNRGYKGFTLDNGLRVILIKDPESTISSACMYVRVGSLKDPKEFQGLAHFLEHMLFLGSKKYPEDGTYKKFISLNGGKSNASTNKYHTQFYFTIKNAKLVEALDIFAQFFVSPLLNEDCTQREVNAVDAEASKNLNQDSRKYYQLLRHLSDEDSILNKYQTGNLKTLSKPGLRQALETFHNKYYSADIMTLAVYHNQDEDELTKSVIEQFAAVPNKQLGKISFATEKFPYPDTCLSKLVRWSSINNKKVLRIRWVLPDFTKHQQQAPLSYLTHLLGHECPGSPAFVLLEDNLITNLSSYGESDEDLLSYIEISMELTEKGYQEIHNILEVIGLYVVLIQTQGIHQWVHEEKKLLQELRFNYKSNLGPADTVESVAKGLSDHGFEDCMFGYYRYGHFDEGVIRSVCQYLKPEHCLVFISSKSFEPEIQLSEVEGIYGTSYSRLQLDPTAVSRLLPDASLSQTSKYGSRLQLPGKNVYIPKSTDLLPSDGSVDPDRVPRLVLGDPHITLFHLQETRFGFPKIHFYLEIADNAFDHFHVNLSRMYYTLWLALFQLEFRSEKYNFELSLASLSTSMGRNGVEVRVKCFHDTLPVILETLPSVLGRMKSFDNEVLFRQILTKQQQQVENRLKGQPSSLNQIYLGSILRVEEVADSEVLEWLKTVTWQNFIRFRDQIFRGKVRYFGMLEGNVTEEHSVQLTRGFVQAFEKEFQPQGHISILSLPERRCLQASKQTVNVYKRHNAEASEPNSALLIYYQFDQNREKRGVRFFVEAFLKSGFFNELRTKQQLGYSVSSSLYPMRGVYGFTFSIQSNHKLPEYCRERVDEYLESQRAKVRDLTEKEFQDITSGLLAIVRKPYTSLFDQSDAHLDQILSMRLECNNRKDLEDQITRLTLEEVKSEFEFMFFGDHARIEIHCIPPSKEQEYLVEADKRAKGEFIPRVSEAQASKDVAAILEERPVAGLSAHKPPTPATISSVGLFKKTQHQFPDVFWVSFAEAVKTEPRLLPPPSSSE